MQSGQILESEFDTLLALSSDAKSFDQALARLNQDGRITRFLDLLDVKYFKKFRVKIFLLL